MVKNPSTFGLKPEKLGRILKICSEGSQKKGKMTSKEQKEELLQDRLSETLLTVSPKEAGLLKELKHLCRISGLLAGEPIRNLLVGPNTDVELLEKVKQHGKKLSKSASSEAEHETANVIYYASIASSLVFHDLKTTKFSYDNLVRAFDFFVKTPWIDAELSTLFNKASMCCQKKLSGSNKV
jgi:hypothetical protein